MGYKATHCRDGLTGLQVQWQAARVDEAFLTFDGSFDVDAYNAAHGEQIDIANVNSMAAVYGYSTTYFKDRDLPSLGFVKREGPLRLSCVSSLQPDAVMRVTAARARQAEAGRKYGQAKLYSMGNKLKEDDG